jgi:hypothetical protein
MDKFFKDSTYFYKEVLKPLSHIRSNYDLIWDYDDNKYLEEGDSYAKEWNELIVELSNIESPERYHDHEDRLCEYVSASLNWNIKKIRGRWITNDYAHLLELGGFSDVDERELCLAAAGRVKVARQFGQNHYDDMEEGHRSILGAVITNILFHRSNRS